MLVLLLSQKPCLLKCSPEKQLHLQLLWKCCDSTASNRWGGQQHAPEGPATAASVAFSTCNLLASAAAVVRALLLQSASVGLGNAAQPDQVLTLSMHVHMWQV